MSNITNWFEYPTNYSNGTEVTGVGSWIQYTNTVLGDSLGAGIVLMIWLATFAMSLVGGVRTAITAASFITFMLSIYLWRIGIVNTVILFVLLIASLASLIGAAFGSKSGGSP